MDQNGADWGEATPSSGVGEVTQRAGGGGSNMKGGVGRRSNGREGNVEQAGEKHKSEKAQE